MRLPMEGLSKVEDELEYVADIIIVQHSGRQGYDNTSNQSPPQFSMFPGPSKYRTMMIQCHFDLGSSESRVRAAGRRMLLDLREARQNTSKERPVIFVAQKRIAISVLGNFLEAFEEAEITLPIANVIGLIWVAHSRDELSIATPQQTVLAASRPSQLILPNYVQGLTSYFSLMSSGLEIDIFEHEMLCFYGHSNLKAIMNSAIKYTPKFSTAGRDIYYLERSNTATEYITSQVWEFVRHIVGDMGPQIITKNILSTLACHGDTHAHAVIARLSRSFQTRNPVPRGILPITECHFSTDWLLDKPEYIAWRHSEIPSTFWLSGSPGSGKSTLTSYVIGDLKSQRSNKPKNHIVVYYLHDSRYRVSKLASMVLTQIIRSLLPRQKRNNSRKRLQAILKNLDDDGGEMSISQLRSYFISVQETIAVEDRLVLVLDGLDEVKEPDNSLVEELLCLAQKQDDAHHIKCFFSGNASWRHRVIAHSSKRIDIDEEVRTRPDLDYFVKSEVTKILKNSYYGPAFYEKLTASSDGVFCRAKLALRNLGLADISDQDRVLSFIDSIPNALTTAYHEMLYNIAEANRKKALRLFAIVTYAFRPLRVPELLEAINFDLRGVYPGHLAKGMSLCDLHGHKYTQGDILRLSAGLLAIGQDQTVSFIHNSVRDFIMAQSSQPRSGWFYMTEYQTHEMLIKLCFYFLQLFDDNQDVVSSKKSATMNGVRDEKYYHFTEYAIQYWSYHYRAAEAKNDHLPGLLYNLIQQNLEHLWYTGGGRSSVSTRAIFEDSMRASLCIGTKVGSVALVKMLLEMGADLDMYIDFAGNNALHLAAAFGNLPVVNLLLERGARFDLQSGVSGRTALQYAAAAGHVSVIKSLLRTERVGRKDKVRSSCGHVPLRTVWVACEADSCRFHCELSNKVRLGDYKIAYGESCATGILNDTTLQKGLTWELPLRPPIIGYGSIDALDIGYMNNRTTSNLEHRTPPFETEESQASLLECLIQTLVQCGIESISEYNPHDKRATINEAIPIKSQRMGHLHLLIDVSGDESMAQNWSRALKIAVQKPQEDSIRHLLEDEAVALPKIFPLSSTSFGDNSVWHGWSLFDQATKPTSLTDGGYEYKIKRERSCARKFNRDYSPE